MKKKILIFIIIILIILCNITIPKKSEDTQISCLITQINYEIGNNYGVAPTKINMEIYNNEIENKFVFDVKNKLYINKIKIGLYDKISINPIFAYGYFLDGPVESYNNIFPIKLKVNENSLVILPYKIIVKNKNMKIELIRKIFEEKELLNIIKTLLKSNNFKYYKYLYVGNKDITDSIDIIRNNILSK